eukprot:3577233-Alexandrium_andersonii.AAC.1
MGGAASESPRAKAVGGRVRGLEPLSDPQACSAALEFVCNSGAQCVQRCKVRTASVSLYAISVTSRCRSQCARGRVRGVQCLSPCSCRACTPPQ